MRGLRVAKKIIASSVLLIAVVGLCIYALAAAYVDPRNGLSADFNEDGIVNSEDLAIFLDHYNQAGTHSQGDVNGDEKVNYLDLSVLSYQYDSGTSSSPGSPSDGSPTTQDPGQTNDETPSVNDELSNLLGGNSGAGNGAGSGSGSGDPSVIAGGASDPNSTPQPMANSSEFDARRYRFL